MFAGLCTTNSPHVEQFVDEPTSKLSAVCIMMHVTWLAVPFDSLRGDSKMKAACAVLNDASKGSV